MPSAIPRYRTHQNIDHDGGALAVQTTKHQQILGYFIEEAKEHLDSIEHGLLNLKATMADQEEMNQVFRAAHSIKGGAAMLGFNSIQRVSHHLEDYFKLLKENPVEIDHKLEDLFLKSFDALKALVEQLQSTFGLRDEDAAQILQSTEPIFAELGKYLDSLIKKGAGAPAGPAVAPDAAEQITKILKVMLQLFKQGDVPKSRQQLVALCNRLQQLSPASKGWVTIVQASGRAIANPRASFALLAPLVIKELKQSSDLLLTGRSSEIMPSKTLQQLITARPAAAPAPAPVPTPTMAMPMAISMASMPSREVANADDPSKATVVTGLRQRQISIPSEPRAAAKALLDAFNKNELIQIAEFLMKAIQ
ncbi:MAG: histidine kinase [Alkalinema sp. RU_4_3]|nr:histidine kinase [Alkalinema sp. RU_4_3]